eukprot:g3595.t1
MDLWFSCNALVEAIYCTEWAESKLMALGACRQLLLPSLKVWGRASFVVQREIWRAVSRGLSSADSQERSFGLRPPSASSESSTMIGTDLEDEDVDTATHQFICTSLRDCLRHSVSHFQNMIAELQPWGTYGLSTVGREKQHKPEERLVGHHLSREQKVTLRGLLVRVACQIIREAYVSSKSRGPRAKDIAIVVRSIVALISSNVGDVMNGNSTLSEDTVATDGEEKHASKSSASSVPKRNAGRIDERTLFAPLALASALLTSPDPVRESRKNMTGAKRAASAEKLASARLVTILVLRELHRAGGLKPWWGLLACASQKVRVKTLRFFRVFDSAEQALGTAWRSDKRNMPSSAPLVGKGEALKIFNCLEQYELDAETYAEIRELMLGRDLRLGADPMNFTVWSRFHREETKTSSRQDEFTGTSVALRGQPVVVPAMFIVLFEMLPRAKPSLQLDVFCELEALLLSGGPHAAVSQKNRNYLRSHVGWQRWFLYFIVVNSVKRKALRDEGVKEPSSRATPPPPPTVGAIDRMRVLVDRLTKSSLPRTVRVIASETLKRHDPEEWLDLLENIVHDPETPIRICLSAAKAVESHFRYTSSDFALVWVSLSSSSRVTASPATISSFSSSFGG